MIYLASPYHHAEERVMEDRYNSALEATAYLMRQGIVVFSPIVHCHVIKQRFDLPGDHNFWLTYDEGILRHCFAMWILCIPGWRESKGVASEIAFCKRHGKLIYYVTKTAEHDWATSAEPPHEDN